MYTSHTIPYVNTGSEEEGSCTEGNIIAFSHKIY